MNIAEAKAQICDAMRAYFTRDEFGHFRIPPESQRPVFLMGPPGIGKTAIMKQVADELGVGLVSYSMTHHTRQSALGLPVIVRKTYGGREYEVSEYTMSEIIASVYDMMEQSGVQEGILFLDEINCVSETLTPTMLQFLQYKTFGRHAVPAGWLVVTAGNPTEYNRSAREFDIVTWDRLKRIDIEPDYPAWKEYALKKGVHASVLTYLDARKENFYKVETTVDGKRFVTARGWDDLSDMIKLYELNGLTVDGRLISQYLQDKEIAEDFAIYYDLFNKYKSDYQVDTILNGQASQEICRRAADAPFDERLTLLGLLLDSVGGDVRGVIETEDMIRQLLAHLKQVKSGAPIDGQIAAVEEDMERARVLGTLGVEKQTCYERILAFLRRHARESSDFSAIKAEYDGMVAEMRAAAERAGSRLEAMFAFAEKVWPEGQELLIMVTELTMSYYAARFIARYGCDAYYRHNQELMFYQRRTDIIKQMEQLQMDI
ncbi:MAG: AAA family ATPase [Clostridiales bacterium]|nr:AAA family ATPase [Candidatus Cacconaster stercorequi]